LKVSALNKKWILILVGVLVVPVCAMAAPAKVAILPFSIHADKDYAFLQKGVVEMLTSRLSAPEKVEVIDPLATAQALEGLRGQSGDALALAAAAQLNADYAIHGSITVLGDSVSIDAKTLDVAGKRAPLPFYKQTQGLGGVIPQINLMAGEINSQVFGIRTSGSTAAATPPTSPAVQAPTPQPAPPAQEDIHMHPEKLLRDNPLVAPAPQSAPLAGSGNASAPANPLNPAFQSTRVAESTEAAGFWKSANYAHMINGVDVGDVDKDGQLETVVATPQKIMVYRFAKQRQQTVAEIETGKYRRNISVSVGDINGNGTAEIFVTALSSTLNVMESSVLEYDGSGFKPIVEKSRYYYSVVQHPTLGTLLLGQHQNSGSSPNNGSVVEMKWKGHDYVEDRRILPGGKANLLGLAYGDIMNDGNDSVVAFDPRDHLRVITTNGKIEWQDEEVYGGTTLYFAMPSAATGDSETPFYLPVRIRAADLNKDGKFEVLVSRNTGGTGRKLGVRRWFSKSTLEALSWDGLGLTPLWKTRELAGRIQDFVVADFDNDGADELLAAVISKEGAIIFTDAQSSLIAFDLKQP
jgi:TolB-like protein